MRAAFCAVEVRALAPVVYLVQEAQAPSHRESHHHALGGEDRDLGNPGSPNLRLPGRQIRQDRAGSCIWLSQTSQRLAKLRKKNALARSGSPELTFRESPWEPFPG